LYTCTKASHTQNKIRWKTPLTSLQKFFTETYTNGGRVTIELNHDTHVKISVTM